MHLDLLSHYLNQSKDGEDTNLSICCWIDKKDDQLLAVAGKSGSIQIISMAFSKVMRILKGHSSNSVPKKLN